MLSEDQFECEESEISVDESVKSLQEIIDPEEVLISYSEIGSEEKIQEEWKGDEL
jgi:hypothetical protein